LKRLTTCGFSCSLSSRQCSRPAPRMTRQAVCSKRIPPPTTMTPRCSLYRPLRHKCSLPNRCRPMRDLRTRTVWELRPQTAQVSPSTQWVRSVSSTATRMQAPSGRTHSDRRLWAALSNRHSLARGRCRVICQSSYCHHGLFAVEEFVCCPKIVANVNLYFKGNWYVCILRGRYTKYM
jgi:hypothetical protein